MRSRSYPLLASAVLCSAGILGLLWLLQRRGPSAERGAETERAIDGAVAVAPLPALAPLAPTGRSASAPEATREAAPVEEQAPTFLGGRLLLDGVPAEGGWVRLRSKDGAFESRAALDFEGRFLAGRVPCTELSLSFEVPSSERRRLLLPTLELTPNPEHPEPLELAWTSAQINVRVLDDDRRGLAARLEILGPHYATGMDTDDDGTAKFALIGAGLFHLRALTHAGLEGEAEFELEPGAELSSVVITARAPALR